MMFTMSILNVGFHVKHLFFTNINPYIYIQICNPYMI